MAWAKEMRCYACTPIKPNTRYRNLGQCRFVELKKSDLVRHVIQL
jgi:hypothetical protein